MAEIQKKGLIVWIAAILFLFLGRVSDLPASYIPNTGRDEPTIHFGQHKCWPTPCQDVTNDDAPHSLVISANEMLLDSDDEQPSCLPSEGFACAELWAEFLRIPSYYYGVSLLLWKDKDAFVEFVTSEWETYLWRGRSDNM